MACAWAGGSAGRVCLLPQDGWNADGWTWTDGAVRTGVDVLKMLALGAGCVFIGRPVSVAAIGGLGEGVRDYFAGIKGTFSQAMLLTGVGSVADISGELVYRD